MQRMFFHSISVRDNNMPISRSIPIDAAMHQILLMVHDSDIANLLEVKVEFYPGAINCYVISQEVVEVCVEEENINESSANS